MTNTELYHFGVKGMRWGHRKARPRMSGAARSARRKQILKRVAIGAGAAAGAAALGYGAYRGKKYISTPHGAAHLMVGALRAQQGIDRVGGAARKAGSAVGSYALGGKHSSRRAGLKAAGAAARSAGSAVKTRAKDAKDGAQIIGYGARYAGGVLGKRAGAAARSAGSAIKTRAKDAKDGAQIIGYGARYAGGVLGKRAGAAAGSAARKAGSAVGSYALGGKHSSRRAAASRAAGKVDQGRAAVSALADAYRTRRKYQGRHVSRGAHAAHFAYDSPGEALYHFALDPYGRYAIL